MKNILITIFCLLATLASAQQWYVVAQTSPVPGKVQVLLPSNVLTTNGNQTVGGTEIFSNLTTVGNLRIKSSNYPVGTFLDGLPCIISNTVSTLGNNPSIGSYRINGTMSSPTATVSGDNIGYFYGAGFDTNVTYSKASIGMNAAENWSTSQSGTYMKFSVTPTNATALTEAMRINPHGFVGIGTTAPEGALHVVTPTNWNPSAYQYIGMSLDGYGNASPGIMIRKANGTVASPIAVAASGGCGAIAWRPHNGSTYVTGAKAYIQAYAAENWNTVNNGMYIIFGITPTNSTTVAERWRMTDGGDFRMTANNGNIVPPTGAGWITLFCTNASAAILSVKNGAGTVTKLSAHDENQRPVFDDSNEFTGEQRTIDLLNLADAMEELLPAGHRLKGKIVKRTSVPVADWRESEQKAKERVDAEIALHLAKGTNSVAEIPKSYTPRPVPAWAADAQKQFDAKWKDATK